MTTKTGEGRWKGKGESADGVDIGTVSVAKKEGFAMSMWLHGKEDYISEAGAMNMFMMKEADDGCECSWRLSSRDSLLIIWTFFIISFARFFPRLRS